MARGRYKGARRVSIVDAIRTRKPVGRSAKTKEATQVKASPLSYALAGSAANGSHAATGVNTNRTSVERITRYAGRD